MVTELSRTKAVMLALRQSSPGWSCLQAGRYLSATRVCAQRPLSTSRHLPRRTRDEGGNMPWRGIGATIAVIAVALIVLGLASGFVVDWAWFSTIGYVGVFWTAFATRARSE